ncbi:RHS repeat domain-containing protein [Pseudomonas sp. D1-2]|uniref:RHS repeat domain-containing protein n=1 Tax=unclassified Pseudomonas TaxID=196821 RepID=UPI003DA83D99
MPCKQLFTHFFLLTSLTASFNTLAEEYYWTIEQFPEHLQERQPSPELACRWLHKEYGEIWNYTPAAATEDDHIWHCHMIYGKDPLNDSYGAGSIFRSGNTCVESQQFNKTSGQCETQGVDSGCPLSLAGNPINFATGYKIQKENDYSSVHSHPSANPLHFSRFYRSIDGVWRHSYSSRLSLEKNLITLVHHDGSRSFFDKKGASYEARPPETGRLVYQSDRWNYQAHDDRSLEFDSSGRLIALIKSGRALNIGYLSNVATVTDSSGNTLQFTEDTLKQPLTLTTNSVKIVYTYNKYKQLTSMTSAYPTHTENKQYIYEDPKDSRLLTGVIDARGVRYATWSYDDQGRAVTSEHAAGIENISVHYNPDGSSTVINALGKKTRYQFELIQGVKRIKSIAGLPSANCPNSNSTFTYDTHGLLTKNTDNNGNITTYIYNDRGLETSRTEASGTSQAKTTTTEWHPTLYSPVRINEPDRSIQYTYDSQGRQLSKTIISR